MTYEELGMLLTYISNAYPKKFEYPLEDDRDAELLEETWMDFLGEYPYPVVKVALKKLIVNKPTWPPAVGELVQEIEKMRISREEKISGAEAWRMVLEAVWKYGAYHEAEAMASLPKKVRTAVEAVGGLRIIGISEEGDSYFMNQFVKVYERIDEREREMDMLPRAVRKGTLALTAKFTGKPVEELLDGRDRYERIAEKKREEKEREKEKIKALYIAHPEIYGGRENEDESSTGNCKKTG